MNAKASTPSNTRNQRYETCNRPHYHPNLIQADTDRESCLVVVGYRAKRTTDPRIVKKHGKYKNQDPSGSSSNQVELLYHRLPKKHHIIGEPNIEGRTSLPQRVSPKPSKKKAMPIVAINNIICS